MIKKFNFLNIGNLYLLIFLFLGIIFYHHNLFALSAKDLEKQYVGAADLRIVFNNVEKVKTCLLKVGYKKVLNKDSQEEVYSTCNPINDIDLSMGILAYCYNLVSAYTLKDAKYDILNKHEISAQMTKNFKP